MQIAGPGVEAVMASVVEVSTRPSPPGEAGEAGQVASLEALCDLWRESRGDQVPHICATLTNAVIHLDTGQCKCSANVVSTTKTVTRGRAATLLIMISVQYYVRGNGQLTPSCSC